MSETLFSSSHTGGLSWLDFLETGACMPIFTVRVSSCFRLGSTRQVLHGAVAILCLLAFGCGCEKISSAQMSLSPAPTAPQLLPDEAMKAVAGLDKFFLHDKCTAQFPPQPDTCLHDRVHEQSFTLGGKAGTVYEVTLRIRGIFEPTTIADGDTPRPRAPLLQSRWYGKHSGLVAVAN